ncbi:glycosyltransferase [Aeromonas caviae]|uniref:glycosyltransferase n=1 Tax=Aeromonas caviae TaxID=648 RepID=UPI001CC80D0C|nr:glycosyltransferase [Aeromonas caviae]
MFNTLYYPNRKGGAERSVQLVCEELVQQGAKVDVVSIWDKVSARSEVINGVTSLKWNPCNLYSVHNYSNTRRSFISKICWQIFDIFNVLMFLKALHFFYKKKPDVVWTNNLSGFSLSIWVAAFLLKIPVCHTARDYYLLSNNVQLYKKEKLCPGHNIFSKVKISLFYFLSKWLRAFVGISDFVVFYHKRYSRCKKHERIYNSVIFNESSCKAKDKLYSNVKSRVFGYLGQINSAKGVDSLISHFLCNSINSTLHIAGKDEEGYAKKYNHERVRFVGFQNPEIFFRNIDCLIVPSLWDEPFGRTVVEALAYGVPVICSSQGGLLELSNLFKSVICFSLSDDYDYDLVNINFDNSDDIVLERMFSVQEIAKQYQGVLESIIYRNAI